MKQLKLLFTVLFLSVLGLGNVWAEEEVFYTNTCPKNTSASTYATYYDVTVAGIKWKAPGNQYADGDWRLGGKSSSSVDRYLYTQDAIETTVTKIVATHGSKNASSVGNVKLDVYSTAALAAAGAAGDVSSLTAAYVDNGSITFTCPAGADWKDRFYRLTYPVNPGSTSSNKYAPLKKVEFYHDNSGSENPTEYSITISDDIANGTVTADKETAAADADVTLTATPSTGYEFGSWNVTNASTSEAITVTDNKFQMPAANVNVSATFNEIQGGDSNEKTYNFADMTDFSTWGSSYEKKTTTFSDGAYAELASANKSSQTVTDCPVTKGGDVIFKAPEGKKIASLTFTCTQWTTKAQTITLNTSANGTGYTATSTTSSNFVLSASNLSNVRAVKFTFSSTSNQVGVKSIKVTYIDDDDPVLESIEVKTAPTTVTYTEGQKFDPAGLVITKIMSAGDPEDVEYAGNESDFTFSPALDAALKTTDAKVTITYAGKPVDQAITVSAFAPAAGEYEISLNNGFYGISTGNNGTEQSAVAKGITVVSGCKSSATSKTYYDAAHIRYYADSYLKLTAPTGFEITKVVFTAGGDWNGSISVNAGTYDNSSKTWTGYASQLDFSFGAQNRASKIVVTYATPIKSTITLATCENGSVGVDGIADLTQVKAGTVVTLTNDPNLGYNFAAYDVYKTSEIGTKVTVTDGKFTMPAYDVTVSATFELAKVFDGTELTLSGEYPTTFWKGDAFSHDGMTVTAHFNTGDETVTGVFSGYDMSTPGTQTVTVTFTEGGASQTATYNITVKTIANTQENAYTAAEANALIAQNKDLESKVYVAGVVTEIKSLNPAQYTNAQYYITSGEGESNKFYVYNGKALNNADFTTTDQLQVGDEIIVYGQLTEYKGTKEMAAGNYIVSLNRPVVLTSIELNTDNVKKTYKIGTDDVFSAENLVVTAHYNVSSNDKTIDLSDVTISGYNMEVANNYTVTVSYTENEVTKSATYQIQVKPNCETLATITMGAAENGTFDLSVKGEQCAEGDGVSTVLTATPAEHYTLSAVTSLGEGEVVVGTVGEIAENSCTISGITASTTITAVFVEDAKGTATFVAGAAEATGTAPASITKYVGENLTVPANTFALAANKFIGWKVGETIYQKGDEFTMVEGGAEFVAQWEALPVWASTYTSNITLSTTGGTSAYAEKVKVNGEATEYDAIKAGASKTAGKCVVTVPAGASALHFHAILWNETSGTLSIKNGDNELFGQTIKANDGFQSNSPYTLVGDPTQDYYNISFAEPLAEATNLTFAASVNRFAIYGVNYVAPASVALDPTTKNFGEVKEGETAEFEFTATKNAFATGDIAVTFEGADAAAFSAGAVDAETGKFTVTFAPAEVRAYSATVKVTVDGAEATATLAGEGISATTPTIATDVETIEFGSVKQDATVADQTVNVTLEYLEAANVAITGTVFTLDKTALSESGAITISANTAAMGEFSETLTISGEGATSKTVTVTMNVISKYASEYTSNVTVGGDIVKINGVEYEAIKKGTSSASQSTTITVPKGTQTLHFHAVAWNDENTVLVVKQGDNTLGSFNLYKDAGVKGNGPSYTLGGNNYDTDQYFSVNVAAYTAEDEAVITFTTTASPYRFVLYGVNQEGGIVPVLDHIAIEGEAEKLTYLEGTAFNPAGLSVKAIYTFDGVEQEPVDVTDEVAWSFSPATLAETDTEVEATATYEGKTANKTISGLTVTSLADLKEENVDFAEAYANLSSNTALTGERGTLNAESYTITYAQNGATNAPTYYYSADEGDKVHTYVGNTITITAQKNIYMVEVSYVAGNTDGEMTTVANNDHGYIVCDGTANVVAMEATVKARITDIKVYYEDQKEEVRGGLSVDKFGTICVEKMTLAPAGATFYTLNYYDATAGELYVTVNTSGRLEAGVPYIFKATGAEVSGIKVADDEVAKENNGFHAVLNGDYIANGTEYGIVGNEVRPAAAGALFREGRCYITLNEVPTEPQGSAAPARAFRVIGGTSVATGFEGLEAIEGASKLIYNGQIVILRDGKCYDTVGRVIK